VLVTDKIVPRLAKFVPYLPRAMIGDPCPPAKARRLSAGRRLRDLSLTRRC
jgi:hypothetical protein